MAKNGYAKAPQCYLIRTLPVSLLFDLHNKAESDAQVIQRQMRVEVGSTRRCYLGTRSRQGRMESWSNSKT